MAVATLTLVAAARIALALARTEMATQAVRVIITSTRRTFAEQRRLFERWKAGRSRFPAAPPGQSNHQKGTAVDLVPAREGQLSLIVPVMARHGFRWAGPGDSVHFDYIGPVAAVRAVRAASGQVLAMAARTVRPRTEECPCKC